ncbi:hypothetical protein [Paenarthrobacter sp. TA1.8]|uniref:hypothetical protein n=1 Tax=Paenarthrobacter sp. TA1.8 TaxID=3400219 RepID=UPI003B427ACC
MRPHPYTGPVGTNDFDDLTADEMSELVSSYKLLGDCFEATAAEDMLGRGFLMEVPLDLVKDKFDAAARARRELLAAVKLARYKGMDWHEIGAALGMTWVEAMKKFTERRADGDVRP